MSTSMILNFDPGTTINLPISGFGQITVDWGRNEPPVTYTYGVQNIDNTTTTGIVIISGTFTRFGSFLPWTGGDQLQSVTQWGSSITNLGYAFYECTSLTSVPALPPLVTTTAYMFYGATAFAGTDVHLWNVTNVSFMQSMFTNSGISNSNLGNWQRSDSTLANVFNMNSMFSGAVNMYTGEPKTFIADLTTWNVSAVTDKSYFLKYDNNTADITFSDLKSPFCTITTLSFDSGVNIVLPISGYTSLTVDLGYGPGSSLQGTTGGTGTVTITGNFSTFGSGDVSWTGALNLLSVTRWGSATLTSLSGAFNGCTSLTSVPALPSTVTNTSYMFKEATIFTGAGIESWNVTNVSDMSFMFKNAGISNTQLSNWQVNGTVANVKNMSNMFAGASAFVGEGIESWNVTGVTNMSSMFKDAVTFNNTNLDNWQRSGPNSSTLVYVENMNSMFFGAIEMYTGNSKTFRANLTRWYVSAVTDKTDFLKYDNSTDDITLTDLNSPFNNSITTLMYNVTTGQVTIPISGFSTIYINGGSGYQPVTYDPNNYPSISTNGRVDISGNFSTFGSGENAWTDAPKLLSVTQWGSTTLTSLRGAFNGCTSLTSVPALPSTVTNTSYMFKGATIFNREIGSWNVTNVSNMQSMFEDAEAFNTNLIGWQNNGTVVNVKNMSNMFAGASAFQGTGIQNWNVFGVTNMEGMFKDAIAFNNNLFGWEGYGSTVANVKNMANMFNGAGAFTGTGIGTGIDSWNVSGVTNMQSMFAGATLFSNTNLGNWQRTAGPSTLANVVNMNSMFSGALGVYNTDKTFKVNLTGWIVSAVTDKTDFLKYDNTDTTLTDPNSPFSTQTPITILNLSLGQVTLPISDYTNITVNWGSGTFTYTLSAPVFGNVSGSGRVEITGDFSTFGSGENAWAGAPKLLSVTQWGSTTLTSLRGAFNGCINLTSVPALPSTVTNTSYMFKGAITFNGTIGSWNVTNVSDMSYMFNRAEAFNTNLSGWQTNSTVANVKNMSNMFNGASAFVGDGINFWNVTGVTNMSSMFKDANLFNNTNIGDWQRSGSTLANVKNMSDMFNGAINFESGAINQWNVTNVTDMSSMFKGAIKFNNIALGLWDLRDGIKTVANVKNMSDMFNGAIAFVGSSISNWTVSGVSNMSNMFNEATVFDTDLGNWETFGESTLVNVTDMTNMFRRAEALYVNDSQLGRILKTDLTRWKVNNVTSRTNFASYSNTDTTTTDPNSPFSYMELIFGNPVEVLLPISDISSSGIEVDWGAGRLPYTSSPVSGDVTGPVKVYGKFGTFGQGNITWPLKNDQTTSASDLSAVTQWGANTMLRNLSGAFNGCFNLTSVPALPPLVTNTSYMFNNASRFVGTGVNLWNVTNVTDMKHMFNGAEAFNINLGDWQTNGNVGNVRNMSNMFNNTQAFTGAGIESWNVTGVSDMSYMFANSKFNNIQLSDWERGGINSSTVSNVKTMEGMFYSASDFVGDGIDSWTVSGVTNFSYMFSSATKFNNTSLGNWTIGTNVNMDSMFSGATKFTGNGLNFWNVTGSTLIGITDMSNMFSNSGITAPFNLSWPNLTANVKTMRGMFSGTKISTITGIESWNVNNVSDMSDMFSDSSCNMNLSQWAPLSNVKTMANMFRNSKFNGAVNNWTLTAVTDMSNMFDGATEFNQSLATWTINTTTPVTMASMFFGATVFNSNLPWNTKTVTDMSHMFANAKRFNSNVPWDVSGVVNASAMFYQTNDFSGNGLEQWDVRSMTDVSDMFNDASGCYSNGNFIKNISQWNVRAVTNTGKDQFFYKGGVDTTLTDPFSPFNLSLQPMTLEFGFTTEKIKLPISDISSSGIEVDWGAGRLSYGPGSDVSGNVTGPVRIYGKFGTFGSGETAWTSAPLLLSVTQWGSATLSLTNLSGAFNGCTSLTSVPALPPLVTNTSYMFTGANIFTGTDVESWDVTNVTDMSNMFNGAEAFNANLGNWTDNGTTENVKNMSNMFNGAISFIGDGISRWNVSGVSDMSYMFMNTTIFNASNLGNWTVTNVKSMNSMFRNSSYRGTGQNVGSWAGINNVTNMAAMFNGAGVFNSNFNGTFWNKLKGNLSDMFNRAHSFEGANSSINSWDVSGVTNMRGMFEVATSCYNNALFTSDLTSWNITNVPINLNTFNATSFFYTSGPDGADTTFSDPSSPFGLPPRNVTAVVIDLSASITWTAPAGTVTGYDISSNPATTLRSTTGTSVIFPSLSNGTSYTFTVTAKFGPLSVKGRTSTPSNSVTPGTPGIPTNVIAVASDASASITWTAPAGTVTGYDISSNPVTTLRSSTGTSLIFTGLTNGTSYTFTVTAKNGQVKGTPSAPSNSVTPFLSNPLFTDLGTYTTQPNPAFKLGSKIYGTFGTTLFSIEGPTYTVLQTLSGTALGCLNRINDTVYGITTGSVFAYDTSSAILRTVGTLTGATGYSALDPSGNLYVTDTTGIYKITFTSMAKISSEIITGALSVSNNVLYGMFQTTLKGINLSTFVKTTFTLPSLAKLESAIVDSGKVYFYDISNSQSIINSYSLTNQTSTSLWNFDANSNKGTDPIDRILIDSSSQVLYGICNKGGTGSGTMYSYNLRTSTMTVLVTYGQSNGIGPLSIAITNEDGNAYVVTGGGDPNITPRIRTRAIGPYRKGQIRLPGFVVACFNHGTKILRLLDDQEVWSPIEELRVGDLVKSYKHGYRAIIEIGKGVFINNPELWHSRMYVGQHDSHEPLSHEPLSHEPLYITGGHGLLVDYLTQEEETAQSEFWGRDEQVIDDKILMVAPVSTEFKGVDGTEVFTYYHFVLENDGDANRRYGVWANGFLTETPSLNLFRAGNFHPL